MKRLALIVLVLLSSGCERLMRNMYEQPREKPMRESRLFPDRTSARAPVPGTLPAADGVLAGASSGRIGSEAVAETARMEAATKNPLPMTLPVLEHGRERFEIYCVPCHSPLGDGDGRVAERGFPHPPTYHQPRLREAPDRHFYDVITNGYGVMRPYADRVPPADRWAIVAYIRALQLSQNPRAEAK